MQIRLFAFGFFVSISFITLAQKSDSIQSKRFSIKQQITVVNQYKPSFGASSNNGSGNILSAAEEDQTSITSTFYLGARLWHGSGFFFNPEIAGGSGLSSTLGIANATNGETFRVGSASPKVYIARCYFQQTFALNKERIIENEDFNKIQGSTSTKYLRISVGKISMTDFFDKNTYAHDPREHFLSWGLMANGAWDYPANTRGYTVGTVLEWITPKHELRYALSMLPLLANGPDLNHDLSKASANTIEYTFKYKIKENFGAIRLLGFYNTANMGSYKESINNYFNGGGYLTSNGPSIEGTRQYGRSKYGFGINVEQQFNQYLGGFFRLGWNDGQNETWAFTEIDQTASIGLEANGSKFKRPNDHFGLAYVVSGISNLHKNYLKDNGKGFMLGGNGYFKYAQEHLMETFYSWSLNSNIFVSGAYQLLFNPGYNADRMGPVNIFSIRLHCVI